MAPRPKPLTNDQIIALGYLIAEATQTGDNDYVMSEECIEPILALAEKKTDQWQKTLTRQHVTYIQEGFRQFLKAAQSEEFSNFIEFNSAELTTSWDDDPVIDFAPLAVARLLLYLLAASIEKNQIRTCPECEKIFLVRRRPRPDKTYHCSNRCAQRYASKEYRKRNKDELGVEERERSHRRHVEKQRRKYGPKVKVERRPRNI